MWRPPSAARCRAEVPLQAVLDIVDFVRDLCAEQSRPCPAFSWATPWAGATRGDQAPRQRRARTGAGDAGGPAPARHAWHGRGQFLCRLAGRVDLFDSSIGGLGGCPFCNHANMQAAGNICTEDMVQLCLKLGIETGIDLDRLIEASRLAEEIIGRTLAGKVMHSDSLDAQRAALRQAQAGSRHERRAAFLGGRRDRHADHQPAGAAQRHQHRGQQPAVRGLGNHRQPSGHPRGHSHLGGLRHLLRRHGLEGGPRASGRKRARTSCGRSRIRSRRACAG